MDAKHDTFVAGCTVEALALDRRKRIFAAVDVVQGPEEQLPFVRSEQLMSESAVCDSDLVGVHVLDLVAVIAMDAPRRDSGYITHVVASTSLEIKPRCVTSRANPDSQRMFLD